MAEPNLDELYGWNERRAVVIQYAIAWGMLMCLVASLVQFGQGLLTGWQGGYLYLLGGLVALEAMLSQRRLGGHGFYTTEWLAYRLSEWVIILLVIKLLFYALRGFAQLRADIALWQEDFLGNFFTPEYLVTALIVLAIWALATIFSEELSKLEGDERILHVERESGVTRQRVQVRANLANLILMVGGVMIFAAGFLQLDWRSLWGEAPPPLYGGVVPILLYFVLAIALLSLTQLAILRVHWSLERIPISPNLAVRWLGYSAVSLLLLAIFVSLLPTAYSVGLLEALGYLFFIVGSVLGLLLMVVLAPLFWLLTMISRLMGREVDVPPPPDMRPEPPASFAAGGEIAWLELLKSLAFWAIFCLVIGFSLYHYIGQNQTWMARLRQLPVLGGLLGLWRGLRTWLKGAGRALAGGVQSGIGRLRGRLSGGRALVGPGWQFINPRRLSPRARVVFFYLAMVRRGAEGGTPRQADQTAAEYSHELHARLPEVGEEVDRLTGEFEEARYSQHVIDETRAGRVQQLWERIRQALRRRPE